MAHLKNLICKLEVFWDVWTLKMIYSLTLDLIQLNLIFQDKYYNAQKTHLNQFTNSWSYAGIPNQMQDQALEHFTESLKQLRENSKWSKSIFEAKNLSFQKQEEIHRNRQNHLCKIRGTLIHTYVLSIGCTETKYIKLKNKFQNFCCWHFDFFIHFWKRGIRKKKFLPKKRFLVPFFQKCIKKSSNFHLHQQKILVFSF